MPAEDEMEIVGKKREKTPILVLSSEIFPMISQFESLNNNKNMFMLDAASGLCLSEKAIFYLRKAEKCIRLYIILVEIDLGR